MMLTNRRLYALTLSAGVGVSALVGCGSSSETAVSEAESAQAPGSQVTVDENGNKRLIVKPEDAADFADKMVAQNQSALAINVLSATLQANPDTVSAWVKRAELLAKAKMFRRAAGDYTRAISLQPDDAKLYSDRGLTLLQQNDLRSAMADFTKAIELNPTFATALNNRGLVRVAIGQYEEAIRDFDAAIQHQADHVDALNNRGFAKMQLERFDESVADFSAALDINGKYVNAWNNRGLAYLRSDRPKEASMDFGQAITLAPGQLKHYLHRSEAFEKLGMAEEAAADKAQIAWLQRLAALTQALKREPTVVSNYLARCEHLLAGNRLEAAAKDVEMALQVNPESVEAITAKAHVYARGGKLKEAAEFCDQAIGIAASNETLSLRGDIRLQTGDYDGAIADYTAAKRLDSGVAQAYLKRGQSYREAGQTELASYDFEKAAEIDPSIQVK